jgi:hypothetical protein
VAKARPSASPGQGMRRLGSVLRTAPTAITTFERKPARSGRTSAYSGKRARHNRHFVADLVALSLDSGAQAGFVRISGT